MPAFDFPPTPTLNDIYTANDVTYICTGVNPSVWKKLGSDTSVGTNRVAVIKHVESSGTSGGQAPNTTSFNTRKLNDLNDPNGMGVTLNTNIFSLPAGTYKIDFSTPFYHTRQSQSRLKYSNQSNVVSGTLSYITGSSLYAGPGSGAETVGESDGHGIITLTETNYFILESRVTTSDNGGVNSYDFGIECNYTDEVYSQVRIEDLKTAIKGDTIGTTRVAVVKDQKNSGVGGGVFVKDAWRDRDLTVKDDPFNFVSLYTNASYQTTPGTGVRASYFSLPAGKYKIKFRAPALSVNEHMAAIGWSPNESDINKTYASGDFNSGGEIYGSSEVSNNNTTTSIDVEVSNFSEGTGIVEISQTSYFKVIHYSKDTSTTSSGANLDTGFGNPVNIASPDPETYTIVEIEDLATAVKNSTSGGKPCVQLYEVNGFNLNTTDIGVPIPFVHQHISQGGMIVNSTKSRITVPQTGVYFVTAMIAIENSGGVDTTDGIIFALVRNGNVYPASTQQTGAGVNAAMSYNHAYPINNTGSNNQDTFWGFSIHVNLNANDYLEVAVADIQTNHGNQLIKRGSFGLHLI